LSTFMSSVIAYDVIADEEYLKKEIDLLPYDVTHMEIKKSIIDVMIKSKWVINEHKNDYLIGVYDGRPKVKITIGKKTLTISEVPTSASFHKRWINSLHGHIIHRLEYYHQVRIANRLL
ncbi:MAG: hypothetical protein AB2551_10775, partial [Candidatus Thiodiazotropha sp.]